MKLTHNEIKALSRVINIAHNLGQFHEQRIEIIEAIHEAYEVINKLWLDLDLEEQEDDVIRVGDKVIYEDEDYYVTHIDDEMYHTFPYKLSKRKEDEGLDGSQLKRKYGFHDKTWVVSTLKELTKVKSK